MSTLTFTTKRYWVLRVNSFENFTRGSGMIEGRIISNELSPEEIYQLVLDHENKQRVKSRRNVIYRYWVVEEEEMTDNREKFGHCNQSSTKQVAVIIPFTYVRGSVITIGEALALISTNKLSENEQACLSCFIAIDLKLDENNLKAEDLDRKIIMISGEGQREKFFEILEKDTQVLAFPEEKLVPLKELQLTN